ncbi:MAG: cupin domain-containing protein [Gammaproteobacteria bacterium]
MNYTRVYCDGTGESHFEDVSVPVAPAILAPQAPPLHLAAPIRAERLIMGEIPHPWASSWHPAPQRQFYFQLSGTLEVKVSDGQVRQFSTGSFILLEDTTGKGHCTRVLGNAAVKAVFVQLPAPEHAAA